MLATTPDWGALTQELGGERVNVYVATTAMQDVHRVEAKPSLVARARSADLVVATGAELEVGWLPVLIQESGNCAHPARRAGYFEAASALRLLEVPSNLDRSMGDIHPQGNPHVQLDPHNIAIVAHALTAQLSAARARAGGVLRGDAPRTSMRAGPKPSSAGKRRPHHSRVCSVVIMHRDQAYLCHWLGLDRSRVDRAQARRAAHRRPISGSSSPSSLATPPKLILLNAYNDAKAGELAVGACARASGGAAVLGRRLARSEGPVRIVRRHPQQIAGGEMNTMLTDFSILWPALIAGVLVAISHVPLGQQVLSRGIVFIDLAIAQVAGLGVIAANSFELADRRLGRADRGGRGRTRRRACCSPGPSASAPRCRRR